MFDGLRGGGELFGIKGPSLLQTIYFFDLANGFVSDYMHCLLLGVVKLFLIMRKCNVTSKYYIKNLSSRLDEIIMKFCTPEEVLRGYRSMAKYGHD